MAAQRGAIQPGSLIRPPTTADFAAKASHAKAGLILAGLRIMIAMVALIGSIVKSATIADDGPGDTTVLAYSAWTFGIATLAFGTLKLGIALVLWGIVRRLWVRVESTKVAWSSWFRTLRTRETRLESARRTRT